MLDDAFHLVGPASALPASAIGSPAAKRCLPFRAQHADVHLRDCGWSRPCRRRDAPGTSHELGQKEAVETQCPWPAAWPVTTMCGTRGLSRIGKARSTRRQEIGFLPRILRCNKAWDLGPPRNRRPRRSSTRRMRRHCRENGPAGRTSGACLSWAIVGTGPVHSIGRAANATTADPAAHVFAALVAFPPGRSWTLPRAPRPESFAGHGCRLQDQRCPWENGGPPAARFFPLDRQVVPAPPRARSSPSPSGSARRHGDGLGTSTFRVAHHAARTPDRSGMAIGHSR